MNCPGCGQSMQQHTVEGNYGVQVEIDACRSCSSFWFDRKEHLQLTPGSTLELIRLMGPHRSTPSALPQVLSCPRCGERLVNTTDIQRNTRFNYFRCPQEDARRHVDPALAANLVMDKLKVERFYNQLEPNPSSLGSDHPRGLIEAGLGALLDILAGL